jgi:hypothetical protein
MAAPFCIKCGAAVADGTRFCVKCGQPVGQAAPSQALQDTQVLSPALPLPPPPAAPVAPAQPYVAPPVQPPPPVQPFVPQSVQPPPPVKEGSGAGIWIGIFGILLLLGGAGLWFYMRGHESPSAQVAAAPTTAPTPAPVAAPAPSTTPEVIPPNPDFAQPEVIPPNPDFAKKDAAPAQPAAPKSQPAPTKPATASAAPAPRLAKVTNPTSGNLHATVEVAQNGEVVFENLPGARLKFTFDHAAWKPTISHQANGTQTLVMRSLKPGIQTTCDVSWEIVP